MHTAVVVLVKAVAGGTLVVAFALLGEVLRPKWLAGLFSAAPSVAIAGLCVLVFDKGDHAAGRAALGMAFGACGFVVFSAAVWRLMARMPAMRASFLACGAWIAVAVGTYLAAFG